LQPPAPELQAGGSNPPLPLGTPWGRTLPALISRFALDAPQPGHSGEVSALASMSSSNRAPHCAHSNSYIGIAASSRLGDRLL
jgi:hypothetical protein